MQREQLIDQIEDEGCQRLAIQAPAGIKQEAIELARDLKGEYEVVIVSEPCYGACDLALSKIKAINCDCLIHIGHNPFRDQELEIKPELPVFYWEYDLEGEPLTPSDIEKIEEETIGLLATIQHLSDLADSKDKLEEAGKRVKIGGKASKTGVPGQVLGCDVTAATSLANDVEAILLLASGNFHATALQQLGRKVYIFNPLSGSLRILEGDKDTKKRKEMAKALKYKDEKKWGILASSKSGQLNQDLIKKVKEKLEALGKETYVFVGDRILEQDLQGFGPDIFVNTACPRLSEDFEEITVVNPQALSALGD